MFVLKEDVRYVIDKIAQNQSYWQWFTGALNPLVNACNAVLVLDEHDDSIALFTLLNVAIPFVSRSDQAVPLIKEIITLSANYRFHQATYDHSLRERLTHLNDLVEAIQALYHLSLWDEENCRRLFNLKPFPRLAAATKLLHQHQLLNLETWAAISVHDDPVTLVALIFLFRKLNLNTQTVLYHPHPHELYQAIEQLSVTSFAGFFLHNDIYLQRLIQHKAPDVLIESLIFLQRKKLLDESILDITSGHHSPRSFSSVYAQLKTTRILRHDERIMQWIVKHEQCRELADVLSYLHAAHLLNAANFNRLMQSSAAWLLTPEALQQIWERIPVYELTQSNFMQLLRFNGNIRLAEQFVQRVLRVEIIAPSSLLNYRQSIHNNAVDRSIYQSIQKLKSRFFRLLSAREMVSDLVMNLKELIVAAPVNLTIKTPALIAYDRLRSISYIKHGLNFESLFALIWLVVHDQEHLWSGVTLENAMESIVNALYEIQRGGNLSALEDRGVGIGELYSHDDPEVTADQPICSEGSFHKLIESLAGIHRDVEIHFVSTQSMYQKLKRLVVSVLSEWLDKSLKEGESPEALHTHLVRTTDSDVGLSECWGDIQEAVTEQMRLTFGNESATQPLLQDVLAQAEFVVLSRESIQHLLNRIHGSVSTSPLSISGISSPPWTRLGLH